MGQGRAIENEKLVPGGRIDVTISDGGGSQKAGNIVLLPIVLLWVEEQCSLNYYATVHTTIFNCTHRSRLDGGHVGLFTD